MNIKSRIEKNFPNSTKINPKQSFGFHKSKLKITCLKKGEKTFFKAEIFIHSHKFNF